MQATPSDFDQHSHIDDRVVRVEFAEADYWAALFDVLAPQIGHAIGLVGDRPDAVERYVRCLESPTRLH